MIGVVVQVRTCWMIALPSISGRPRSSNMISGQCELMVESACTPVVAEMTSYPLAVSVMVIKLVMPASSSTMSTLVFSSMLHLPLDR